MKFVYSIMNLQLSILNRCDTILSSFTPLPRKKEVLISLKTLRYAILWWPLLRAAETKFYNKNAHLMINYPLHIELSWILKIVDFLSFGIKWDGLILVGQREIKFSLMRSIQLILLLFDSLL